jgi:hypothetical protein
MRELGEMKQDIPESLQIRCAIAYFMCELRSEGTSLQDLADSFMLVVYLSVMDIIATVTLLPGAIRYKGD